MTFTYTDLIELDLGKIASAATDWKNAAAELAKLRTQASDGLQRKSEAARWEGVNATVTRDFVRSTAKEFDDLRREAESIHLVLTDAHAELTRIQRQAKKLSDEARAGDPSHKPEPDLGLRIIDPGDGTVRLVETFCDVRGTSQRAKDLMQWYADTLTGLVSHAAEVDAATVRALRASHGGDPHNAGHATYTSLDPEQVPRAMTLASLGAKASPAEQAELRRLWQSISPDARAELWRLHRDDLLAAGLLNPTVKRAAPDRGSGRHDVDDPGFGDYQTRLKMRGLIYGADTIGSTDAARHMGHYLGNTGTPMELPVDKMLSDDKDFSTHIDTMIRDEQDTWRKEALDAFAQSGGRPVALPVELGNTDFSFDEEKDPNWFFAVGSTRSNVTGVVTVTPDHYGRPVVGLEYQVNAWDRYNWDEKKGVTIGKFEIPDGEMGRQHVVGLAREYDMAGSSSVKQYDLGSSSSNDAALPDPDDPGRDGGRTDPGREHR